MTSGTLLLLSLAFIIAACLSYYQYLYKANERTLKYFLLAFLRFLSWCLAFVLLINPVFSTKKYEIEKTPLPVFLDNSESVADLKAENEVENVLKAIQEDHNIKENFDIHVFQFDQKITSFKTLDFKGKQTHIEKLSEEVEQLFRNKKAPVILVTDGNQTYGNDYVYSFTENTPVYPVVLGDTATVLDLKIDKINVNPYAFHKNKFPVELFLSYNGSRRIESSLQIMNKGSVVAKQSVYFDSKHQSQVVQVYLEANVIGNQKYTATLSSSLVEKNKKNNSKPFVVDVIDQRTEIAIISEINHPDLGALKRSIEKNQERKVTLLTPDKISDLSQYNVVILYQPTPKFRFIFDANAKLKLGTWIITGKNTDFDFLNSVQHDFVFRMNNQTESYSPDFNPVFNAFLQEDIHFNNFPPLENKFGAIRSSGTENTLLFAKVRNIETTNPLLAFKEEGNQRRGYLFGENIWKWRMESYLSQKSFKDFDLLTDKIIQYLATNSDRKTLLIDYERFYNSGETIGITAQFFNKNYEFDENAELSISLKNKETNQVKNYNFMKANRAFKVNFANLSAGNYSFIVTEKKSKTKESGSFEVLDFNIEKQFVNPDFKRLKLLAQNTNGKVFFPNEIKDLLQFLSQNKEYLPVQKEVVIKEPLIEWKWLLLLLTLCLASEWFVRKYNGLL